MSDVPKVSLPPKLARTGWVAHLVLNPSLGRYGHMSNRYSRARFGAAVVVAFLCGLVFASGFDLTHFSWAQSRGTPTKPAPSQIASAIETQSSFEAVVDAARPAVVSIETERFQK